MGALLWLNPESRILNPAAGLVLLLATGCVGGSGSRIGKENDRLRARVHELERETEELKGRNAELASALDSARRPESPSDDVIAATPRVVGITLGSLSHARDGDGDGQPDHVLLYVKPTDGLGRFVQLVGELKAHVAILPDDGVSVTIGQVALGPAEVREAYRSGFASTYYAVTVPLPEGGVDAEECVAQVAYVDGHTGERMTAELGMSLKP